MESEFFTAMPHDLMAEQSVLGAMMLDAGCIPDVVTEISAEDFYGDANRSVYETICGMFNRGEAIDPVTVSHGSGLENAERLIMEMITLVPTARNAGEYARIIKDRATLRSVIRIADEMLENARSGGGGNNVVEAAEKAIYSLRNGQGKGGLKKAGETLAEVYQDIAARSKNKGGIPGISTGLAELDSTIMGLNKGELIYLASRPGMGKTSLAMNIAMNAARRGVTVAVFSLEMSAGQLIRRLLSGEAYVDAEKLQTGDLSRDDWKKLSAATASISKANLYIDDNSMVTVSDMNAQCRRIEGLGLVVIDYLQLMSSAAGTTAESRQQTVSEISRMLKIMAKELNVPVLCLSQLSRASTQRQDKRPNLSDLRESGSLEQDADVVLGIYRPDYFDREADTGDAELLVMKNRNGRVGSIKLRWIPQYTTYTSAYQVSSGDEDDEG